ncbi:hypothetical protein [Solimicrobium silvestre]|uniref:Peptidase MA superfamily n=1 Tax=Solimicrobium silvestre TaxID=2099400 RepID=A0A2S9GYX3_9BURK|nr:hypothetical protein [Solimicrobium silvestre]PRC92934.1 hypothetical protein S2091_2351 [Solimicrobium silvestre]
MSKSHRYVALLGSFCVIIGTAVQAAEVKVEINLAAPDGVEVSYTLPDQCKELPFENKSRSDEPIRATWQALDDCGSVTGDVLSRTKNTCSVMRFRVPATSNTPPGYYPSAFPLIGGVYVHTSNYAVSESCGKLSYRFVAPGIAAAGHAYKGSVIADTQATGDASALLMQEPVESTGGTIAYFDPRLSPVAVEQIKEVADGTVSYLKTVLPDAVFKAPILAAVAASEPGGPNIRGNAGDVLLASFYNWPQQPGPKEREKLTLLVAHEFSHRFQLRDAVDVYTDSRLIHEGGAEFLRWLTSIQKGWLSREEAAAQVDDALTQCILYTNRQDWHGLTPKAIAGNRLEYVCGLPVYVYGLAARQGQGSAFARFNDFYKELRAGKTPDFAHTLECGANAQCQARWFPSLLGAGVPMETQWGKLAQETGFAKAHAPNQSQRDRMVLQSIVKLMRDDCGGRRSTTETPNGVLIDGLSMCKTLRADIDVRQIEDQPVFGGESTLAAMVAACTDRHEVKLGAKNGGSLTVPCGEPYSVRSEFYGIDIDKVLKSLLQG